MFDCHQARLVQNDGSSSEKNGFAVVAVVEVGTVEVARCSVSLAFSLVEFPIPRFVNISSTGKASLIKLLMLSSIGTDAKVPLIRDNEPGRRAQSWKTCARRF